MSKLAEIQRFIIWLCGSIMVFGFIATLIAYLLYDNQTPADCKEDDCKPQSDTVVVSADDNRILKIVAPTLTAVGLVIIICVRCWQQNTNRQTVAASGTATNDGEDNGGYQGPEFDCGAPPSYNDALHMEVISEAHGTFPVEPPPKYDEALAQIEECTHSLETRSELTIHRDSSRYEVMEENIAAVHSDDDYDGNDYNGSSDNYDDNDHGDESSETSSVSEDAVSINDSQTVESTEIIDHPNHNEQRTTFSTDNRSMDEHEIRETRILVHQRDSCLSSADIQEFPEQNSEQINSRDATHRSSLSNERTSHYRADETLEVVADDSETDVMVHRGQDDFNNEYQRSETDTAAPSTAGRTTEQNSYTSARGGNALSSSYTTVTSITLSECPISNDGPVNLEDSAASAHCQVTINGTSIDPTSMSQGEHHTNESTQQQGVFYV